MSSKTRGGLETLATLLTIDDTLKNILLSAGTKCEYDFNLAKIETVAKDNLLQLSRKEIKKAILVYCGVLRNENQRVLNMETEDLTSSILRVTFTVKLFDGNELPLLDTDKLRSVISSGEWRNASGRRVRKQLIAD
jgi:hypothetical protein